MRYAKPTSLSLSMLNSDICCTVISQKERLSEVQKIKERGVLLVPFFFKLVTLARTGKGLEDDGLSGRGREVA